MIERRHANMVEDRRALFSECGSFRYLLEIRLRHLSHRPLLPFIGLNPSTADERLDDPTIRRERRYALDMGFGGLAKANLAALRATAPSELFTVRDPIGPENTAEWLAEQLLGEHVAHDAERCQRVVVAGWGAHGAHRFLIGQAAAVVQRFGARLHAFGFTRNGHPLHPLYLRADARPRPSIRTLARLVP